MESPPNRQIHLHWSSVLLLLGVALLCSGCVTLTDTEASQEQRQDVIAILEPGQSFHQGFTSRRSGMSQINFWLRTPVDTPAPGAQVEIKLYRVGDEPQLLADLEIPLEQLSQNELVSLVLPPVKGSRNGRFEYLVTSDKSDVQVLGRLEDVYAGGEASVDGEFILADAAFQLSYDYGVGAVVEDFLQMLNLSWLVLPLAAILLLPGWLMFSLSGKPGKLDWGERIAVYLGLSLSAFPIVMAWTSLLGLRWSRGSMAAALGFLTAAAIYRLWVTRSINRNSLQVAAAQLRRRIGIILHSGPSINLGLVAIFLITLFVRIAMVRDLSASPWVDSVHHALTTRLIMEGGSFLQSYAPFLDIEPSGYHPGFHSVLAAFLWLSGMDLVKGMLVFGQVLNALMVFPLYLFATLITRRRLAGLLAAMVAGLLTPMPAYYTSWGRYTQLAGLAILPVALLLVLLIFQSGKWKASFLAAVALAGLSLTHYRVAAFLGCLLLAWAFITALKLILSSAVYRQKKLSSIRNALFPLLSAFVLSVGLALPVLVPALTGLLGPKLNAWRPPTRDRFSGVTWPYVNTAWGSYALVLAGLGFLWSLARRKTYGLTLLLWIALLFMIANLGALGLPGSGFVNTISVTISLFLPVAVLAGDMLSELIQTWRSALPWRWRPVFRWVLAASALLTGILSTRPMLGLLNPVTFLYRPPDRAAIVWMQENIPPGETVLVNPFAWGYGQYAGNDGGYWLSALAGLPTVPPPVLYGLSNSRETIEHINTFSQQVIDHGNDPQALHALLINEGIRYVFIGARGGAISASALRGSQLFAPRYARNGVFVFEVIQ